MTASITPALHQSDTLKIHFNGHSFTEYRSSLLCQNAHTFIRRFTPFCTTEIKLWISHFIFAIWTGKHWLIFPEFDWFFAMRTQDFKNIVESPALLILSWTSIRHYSSIFRLVNLFLTVWTKFQFPKIKIQINFNTENSNSNPVESRR